MTIDRNRATRVGALVALVVLGLTTLPGLLKTPPPPPIPADVGFRPSEMARYRAAPQDHSKSIRESPARKSLDSRQSANGKKVEPKKPKKRPAKRDHRGGTDRARDPEEATSPSPTPQPTPAASEPVLPPPPPPADPVGVSPSPPPPLPQDGSQEFAPR